MLSLPSAPPRITLVDALRGLAVLAIILVHNLEHFIFPVYPTNSPAWLNIMDQGVHHGIFALLFGLTFHIQSANMARRGGDFGYRFLWRMVMLVGFASHKQGPLETLWHRWTWMGSKR